MTRTEKKTQRIDFKWETNNDGKTTNTETDREKRPERILKMMKEEMHTNDTRTAMHAATFAPKKTHDEKKWNETGATSESEREGKKSVVSVIFIMTEKQRKRLEKRTNGLSWKETFKCIYFIRYTNRNCLSASLTLHWWNEKKHLTNDDAARIENAFDSNDKRKRKKKQNEKSFLSKKKHKKTTKKKNTQCSTHTHKRKVLTTIAAYLLGVDGDFFPAVYSSRMCFFFVSCISQPKDRSVNTHRERP